MLKFFMFLFNVIITCMYTLDKGTLECWPGGHCRDLESRLDLFYNLHTRTGSNHLLH